MIVHNVLGDCNNEIVESNGAKIKCKQSSICEAILCINFFFKEKFQLIFAIDFFRQELLRGDRLEINLSEYPMPTINK